MRKFVSKSLQKTSSLPPNITIPLNSKEQQIFKFLADASEDISTITGQQPTPRAVGGWVRDRLLGEQSKDLDITVNMPGDQFANYLFEIAKKRFGNNQQVVTEAKTSEERPDQIKNLSVAFLRIYGQDVEILPLRGKEVYEAGSRNPIKTEKVGPEADAYRRDLSVNSLFYNISTGRIEDFTGQGYDDLLTMTLRTPTRKGHNPVDEATRILTEDPLRLLRIVRFYARYPKSKIAPEVLQSMKNPDIQTQITRRLYGDNSGGIVPERTSEELRKIMSSEDPEKGIKVLYETGLLQKLLLLPEAYNPLDMDQKNNYHSMSVIDHTLKVIKNVNDLSKEFGLDDNQRMVMNFSALFHDIGKLDPRSHKNKPDGTRNYYGDPSNPNSVSHEQASQEHWMTFAKALKLSDKETSTIADLVVNHMNPHQHVENIGENPPSEKQLRKYLRNNPSWVFQYIHAMADAMSKSQESDPQKSVPYRQNLERLRNMSNADQFGNIAPIQEVLKGPEIIQIVGLPPRPPKGVQLGYIEVVKEIIRENQDANPKLTPQEATQIVQALSNNGKSGQGPLAPYFQNVV